MTAAFKNQFQAQAPPAPPVPPPPTQPQVDNPLKVATSTVTSTTSQGGALPQIIKYPTAPDTSTGDKKVFNIDVQVAPHKVLQELCPSGIPQDAMQALGELLAPGFRERYQVRTEFCQEL